MKYSYLLSLFSVVYLVGCGGGSDSTTEFGRLSVSLTDGPVDEALHVYVTIEGVSINRGEGGWVDHNWDEPVKTDLLALQSGNSLNLLSNESVEAGTYEIRLNLFSNDDNELDHSIVIEESGGEHELFIPSGAQTGLKLSSSIVVPANGTADYTIDFDVRRSVVLRGNEQNNNGYLLTPVLRLIDNTRAGSISGTIADTSLLNTDCSDEDPLTHNAIYVFEGADVTPDDYGSDGAQAVTTAIVNFNEESGQYTYMTAPLLEGDYTVSLTCNADLEDTETDDELMFKATENRTVVAD